MGLRCRPSAASLLPLRGTAALGAASPLVRARAPYNSAATRPRRLAQIDFAPFSDASLSCSELVRVCTASACIRSRRPCCARARARPHRARSPLSGRSRSCLAARHGWLDSASRQLGAARRLWSAALDGEATLTSISRQDRAHHRQSRASASAAQRISTERCSWRARRERCGRATMAW